MQLNPLIPAKAGTQVFSELRLTVPARFRFRLTGEPLFQKRLGPRFRGDERI